MTHFVHIIRRDGKTYHYFRPGRDARAKGGKSIRLSDDYETALHQARDMTCGELGAPFADVRRHITILVKEGRRRAKRRKVAFTVTVDELLQKLDAQAYRCAVSGVAFDLTSKGANQSAFRHPYRPSLDRIRAGGPYAAKNVRIVCCAVNIAMNEWGYETLIEIAQGVVRRNASRTSIGKRIGKGVTLEALGGDRDAA